MEKTKELIRDVGVIIDKIDEARPGLASCLNSVADICSVGGKYFFPLTFLGSTLAGAANFIKPKEESRLQAESIRAHKDSNSTSKQHKSDAIDSIKDLNLNISSVHNDVNNMNANMSSNFTSLKKDVQDMNTNITSLKKDVRDLHVDMKSQIKSSEKNLKDFMVKQDKIIFDQLSTLKENGEKFLDGIFELNTKKGMKDIHTQYKVMLNQSKIDLYVWASKFDYHYLQFTNTKADFDPDNLNRLFKHVLDYKCTESYEELNETFNYVLTSRIMYTDIYIRFHIHQNNGKNDPEAVAKYVNMELENFSGDIKRIKECMTKVCRYFNLARSLPVNHPFFSAVHESMPGLTQRDKDIMLWMITQRPSFAQGIENNKSMIVYLFSNKGLNPSNIMNCCFRMLSILILNENSRDSSGLTKNQRDFLEFIAADRENDIVAEAHEIFSKLKKEEITKEDLDASFCTLTDLCFSHGFDEVIKMFHTMVSQENKLRTWAYKNHTTMAAFEDHLYEFRPVLVKAFLERVCYEECSKSLDPMYCAFRFVIYTRSVYCLIYLTYLAYAPSKLLAEVPGLDPVQDALDEMEEVQNSMKSTVDAANLALQGLFTAALTAKPKWKLNLRFIPEFYLIPTVQRHYQPRTEEIFVKDEYCKTLANGEKNNINYPFFKYAQSGIIEYHEKIRDKDTDLRFITKYVFDPIKLDWKKVDE